MKKEWSNLIKGISIFQIKILIISIIAFGFLIGGENFELTSANNGGLEKVKDLIASGGKVYADSSYEGGGYIYTEMYGKTSLGVLGTDINEVNKVTSNLDNALLPTPSATGTPAGFSDHGYAGDAGEFIFGAENVAPKGYEWNAKTGNWVTDGDLGASGFGYSVFKTITMVELKYSIFSLIPN